jgi:hypothetical protein
MDSLKVILVAITAVVIWAWLWGWRMKVRTKKLAEQRAGEGFTDFAAHFADAAVPIDILLNTYDYFEDCNSSWALNFPDRATDNISDVYGIMDEDLEDAVSEILQKCGHRWFSSSEQSEPPSIETVEDLVLYVASAPLSR